jgi:gliding motility-associated-like protein
MKSAGLHLLTGLIFGLLLLASPARSTHIVGGELERTHISGFTYRVSLILYFDLINGNPGANDPSVTVGVFSKSSNSIINYLVLPFDSESQVPYTNPLCAIPSIATKRILYSAIVSFPPGVYFQQAGYYIAWDRCCRNGAIINIIAPGATGQLFYMEFPASTNLLTDVFNSSPSLFPPVRDYACVNQLFEYSIAGNDPDGDSLVYSLVSPLAGFSAVSNPAPIVQPGPYPFINFQPGLGVNNMIPGNPSFQVNSAGIIRVRPSQIGLYVFAVRCEEFRAGQKIGEVRREFQIFVIACGLNTHPSIAYDDFAQANAVADTLSITDSSRCFSVNVTDIDPNTLLSLRGLLTGSPGLQLSIPVNNVLVNTGAQIDTLDLDVCLAGCIPSFDTLNLSLILEDQGCPFTLKDTARFVLITNAITNQKPTLLPDVPEGKVSLLNNAFFTLNVAVSDPELDSVSIRLFSPDIDISQTGILIFPDREKTPYVASMFFRTGCQFFSLDSMRLMLIFEEQTCLESLDTLFYTFHFEYENKAPDIGRIGAADEDSIVFAEIDQPLEELVYLTDADFDPIQLNWQSIQGQVPSNFKIEQLVRLDSLYARITWTPRCTDVSSVPFAFQFVGQEFSCENLKNQKRLYFQPIDIPEREEQPNFISPNQDGKNDRFSIDYLPDQCQFEEISIFNRWGRLVFHSTDDTFQWDGGGEPDGTYYYFARYENKTIKGFVMMIR